MKLTIIPVGRCSKSNHQQYKTQDEALQVANSYRPNIYFDVYQCPHCGYWELKKVQDISAKLQEPQTSSLEEFVYDEQANANKLIERGWLCLPPNQVDELRKIMNGGVNATK